MLSHHNRQTLEISVAYHDKGSFLAHVTSDVGLRVFFPSGKDTIWNTQPQSPQQGRREGWEIYELFRASTWR